MADKDEWSERFEKALRGEVLPGQRFVAEHDRVYMAGMANFLQTIFNREDNLVTPQMREMIIIAIQAAAGDWDVVRAHIRRAWAIDVPPKMILETLEIAALAGGVGALYGGAAVLGEELKAAGKPFA